MAAKDGERRTPKYALIAADLAQRIGEGEWTSEQAMPSQRELSVSYGVTLMTLRQALAMLTDQGLVVQQPGRGTFVSRPRAAYPLGTLHSLSDDLRAQGRTVDTVVLAREDAPLPEEVAERLDVPAGTPGQRIERLRRLGTTPAIHQTSWLPEAVAARTVDADLTVTSLYDALTTSGVTVASAEERLRPALLDPALAALLNRRAGAPVFHSDRVTFDEAGTPVVFDRATILGEFVEVRTVRAASSMTVSWTDASAAGL